MPHKYPIGLQDFSEVRTGNYVYVDKTYFVEQIATQSKYYFLSRPRRFGKSLLLSTCHYLYLGRKELFEGLYIYDKWDWSKKNPIIKISFASISHKEKGLFRAINDQLNETINDYGLDIESDSISAKFQKLIKTLHAQQGKVVVLIDEYDKPIIDYLGTKDIHIALENREILKSFYSILKDADPHLELVFITGVSKFSRVSIFSDLNNLRDISTETYFDSICGINQKELDSNFAEELTQNDPAKIKRWYNGYSWGGSDEVYNPFSLLNFFAGDKKFKNYWFVSGTPTFLINLSKKYQRYDFESVKIRASQLSAYDIEQLQIIPLMFQTGYLTIKHYIEDDDIYELGYPNEEVRQSYLEMLADSYANTKDEYVSIFATEMRDALKVCNLPKVESIFNSIFKSIPYEIWQKENEHYYHAIIHLTFRLLGIYIESQVQTSDGRIDALVQIQNYVYCFEFKLDGSASQALQQIKDKNYLSPYQNQGKVCIGIGLNFSSERKKVEQLLWEEIS